MTGTAETMEPQQGPQGTQPRSPQGPLSPSQPAIRGGLKAKPVRKTPQITRYKKLIKTLKKKSRLFRKLDRKIKGTAKAQSWYDSLAKKILPVYVEVFETHIEIGKKELIRTIVVGRQNEGGLNFPAGLSANAFDEIMKYGAKFGVRISISETLIKKPSSKTTKELLEAWFDANVESEKAALNNPAGATDLSLEKVKEDIKARHDGIWDRSESAFQNQMIITIRGQEDNVLAAESATLTHLGSELVGAFVPDYLHIEAWLAGMAAPVADSRFYVEVATSTAVKLASANNINPNYDPYGLYWGKNTDTGADVITDLNALQAKQAIWFGATGSGKTFSAHVVLMRLKDMLNYRIAYISRKGPDRKEGAVSDYEAVARFYEDDAEIIVLGEKGHSINPLQILYDEKTATDADYDIIWNSHRRTISAFFEMWFKKEYSPNMEAMLEDALDEAYDRAGIYQDKPETWKRPSPKIADLREIWFRYMQDKETKMFEDRRAAGALYRKTRNAKPGGSMSYLNEDTNIDFSKDWITISLHRVDKRLQDALYILVTSALGMRFNTDSSRETVIFVDEARAFLRNPEICNFLLDTLTMGRSHGVSLWLATQQPADLIKAKVEEEFSTNSFISVALGAKLKPKSAKYVKDFFGLSESAMEALLTCDQGEALLIIDDEISKVRFEPTPLEEDVIKGRYIPNKPPRVSGYKIKEIFLDKGIDGKNFIERNQFFLKSMLEDPRDEQAVIKDGWRKYNVPRVVGGTGSTNLYYKPGTLDLKAKLVTAKSYGKMSIDHLHVTLQKAAFLMEKGFTVSLNPNNYADLVFQWKHTDGKIRVYAAEYEEAGSHTKKELNGKWGRLIKYDDYRFICQDPEVIIGAEIPPQYVIKRGREFEEWIESIISETNLKPQEPPQAPTGSTDEPEDQEESLEDLGEDPEEPEKIAVPGGDSEELKNVTDLDPGELYKITQNKREPAAAGGTVAASQGEDPLVLPGPEKPGSKPETEPVLGGHLGNGA